MTSTVIDDDGDELELGAGYESFSVFVDRPANVNVRNAAKWEDFRERYCPDPEDYETLAQWDEACLVAADRCYRDWMVASYPELQRVAAAATVARDATVERDIAIGAARIAGFSLREIGLAAGLSHTAIAKIDARDAQ